MAPQLHKHGRKAPRDLAAAQAGDGLRLALQVADHRDAPRHPCEHRLNASIGEGVIYDLRVALYAHLQRMSLRFFTHTKTGELMSRLNNDVVGAQNAISTTIVQILTNLMQVVAALAVMLTLEWRLPAVSGGGAAVFLLGGGG